MFHTYYFSILFLSSSPPDPHQDACSWLTSHDMIQNLAYIGAVPDGGISTVRVHFLLDAVSVFRLLTTATV